MRKGFDGLCALVAQGLLSDPLNGDLFVFVSRNRVRAKGLHFDGIGLCVYAKRLERGLSPRYSERPATHRKRSRSANSIFSSTAASWSGAWR
jgi:transposase